MPERTRLFKLSPETLLIIACAIAKFTIHMLTATNYGYFVDELYTIALSKHLAFGYVDLPPLVPALLALNRVILGESLLAIHVLPALAGSATLVLVCLITKKIGGGLYAIGLSALAFIVAPVWLIMYSFFAYDGFDQLILASFIYVLVSFIQTGNRKLWLALGLVAGIACLSKATILYLGPGFLVALLISKYRKDLLTPWPWLGLGIILVLISPYLFWEYSNQWPTLEYWASYRANVLPELSVWQYLVNILLLMNPLLLPLLALGLYRVFKRFGDVDYSFFAVLFLVSLVFLFGLKAKTYMLVELFMPLIAAGAIFVEERLAGAGWRKMVKVALVPYLLIAGILVVPWALPMLPPAQMRDYARDFGFMYQPIKFDKLPRTSFPQEIANRIGWDHLAQVVGGVYNGLPADERKSCGIFAEWYGPAGAIDHYGLQYGLPPATSGHLTYYLWGPGKAFGECTIVIAQDASLYYGIYSDIQQVATVNNDDAMPYNTNLHIYICRKPKAPVDEIWPHMKNYY